jgi:hypothetical protein
VDDAIEAEADRKTKVAVASPSAIFPASMRFSSRRRTAPRLVVFLKLLLFGLGFLTPFLAIIFKLADDCRQDALCITVRPRCSAFLAVAPTADAVRSVALCVFQIIQACKNIFQSVGLELFLV